MAKTKKDRIGEVAEVFLKYGLKKGLKGSLNPINIRMAFEELGPTYVKIGQILSTRPDILPSEYIRELSKLQDNVKPESFTVIKSAVESSLNCPLDQVFTEFDEETMASASIADVHRARLISGEQVVVKVQRPGAAETILSDIAILKKICRLNGLFPKRGFIDIADTLDSLEENAKLELDFRQEAANAVRFRENNKEVRFITAPKVFEPYTSQSILVMEYIDGTKIDDLSALEEQGYDLHDIGVKIVDNYLTQILEDGFFHADPHPGNIIISGGQIAYIDFGLMGSIDKSMLENLNEFIRSLAKQDIDALTNAILRICSSDGDADPDRLSAGVDKMYRKYIAMPLDKMRMAEILRDVSRICTDNSLTIPKEFALIGKGLVTIENLLAKVAPDINILKIVAQYEVRRAATLKNAVRTIAEALQDIYRLPSTGLRTATKLLDLIDTAQSGKLSVKIDDTRRDRSMEHLNGMINRLVFGLVVAALIIGSAIVINANAGPKLFGISVFGVLGYCGAAVLGFWLIISILKSKKM